MLRGVPLFYEIARSHIKISAISVEHFISLRRIASPPLSTLLAKPLCLRSSARGSSALHEATEHLFFIAGANVSLSIALPISRVPPLPFFLSRGATDSMPVRKRNITASVTLLVLALLLVWIAISTSRGVFSRLDMLDSQVQQLKTQLQRVSTQQQQRTAIARGASDAAAAAKTFNGQMPELQLPVAAHTQSELKPELVFCFWAINPSLDKMEASSKQAIQTVQKFHGDYHLLGAGNEFHRVAPGGFTDGKAANRLRYQVRINRSRFAALVN